MTIPRETGLHFAIDANRINARGKLPNMNRLEKWNSEGLISLLMPETAHREAWAGSDPLRRRKTSLTLFSLNMGETSDLRDLRAKVTRILSPEGEPDRNTANDIDILVNARKYRCMLITADGASRSQPGGILGARDALRELGVIVLTDFEAVALVEDSLRRRDQAELNLARVEARKPARWVGQDF